MVKFKSLRITILTDDCCSWFIPYGRELVRKLKTDGHKVAYVHAAKDVNRGDVCFILSCIKMTGENVLARNRNNIVVHAADLPAGRGFSPLQWQVQNGAPDLVMTLFEAVKAADAGPYYIKKKLEFDGTELLLGLRKKMAEKIIEMCLEYIKKRNFLVPLAQIGKTTFYRRRTAADDELDVNKTIAENFNHFRIADNEKHPVYFVLAGKKYYLKISDTPTDGVTSEKGVKQPNE